MSQTPIQQYDRRPGSISYASKGCPADKESRRLEKEKLSRTDVDKVVRIRKED